MSYSVSQVSTAQLAEYLSWDVVWFFHNNTHPDEDLDSPTRIMQHNYDWETIADAALAAGVSAVSTHAIDQAGFRFFDSGKKLPPFVMGAQTFPAFSDDYKITSTTLSGMGITPDHMYRFHKAFTSRGIKVGFYINWGQALNLFDPITYATNASARACWSEFLVKEIKWLTYMYDWDFVWIDFDHLSGLSQTQRDSLYQAMRLQTGSLVIKNSPLGITNFKFPADVKQCEFDFLPSEGAAFWDSETTISLTEYYIPSGLAYTGLYSQTDPGGVIANMWQARLYSGTAGLIENLTRDQSHFNTWYSYARTRNVPFFMNMPLRNGALDATYLNRAQNLVAS